MLRLFCSLAQSTVWLAVFRTGSFFYFHLASDFTPYTYFGSSTIAGLLLEPRLPYWLSQADGIRSLSYCTGRTFTHQYGSVLCLQNDSASLSVKMSVLLYLPGILVVLFRRTGLLGTIRQMLVLILSQVAIGWPFLSQFPRSYLKYSYEFTRAFLYKWTVNWRFVSEETFLSSAWARGLLLGHLATLIAFGLFKWCRRDGGVFAVLQRGLRSPLVAPSLVPISSDCRLQVIPRNLVS